MQKRVAIIAGTALAFLTLCPASNTEAGQIGDKTQNPAAAVTNSGTTSAESLLRFDTVLNELSQKYRIALVCESRPLLLTPKDADAVKALEQALSHPHPDVDEQVNAVAAAFDYQATRANNGKGKDKTLFLLTKRYTSPSDLPEVTLEEADISFRNILRATRGFAATDTVPADLIVQLLTDATPDEQARFAKGVPFTDLTPPQKAIATQLAGNAEIGRPLEAFQRVGNRFAGLRQGTAFLGRADFAGLNLPCYQGGFGPNRAIRKVFISYWAKTTYGGGTAFFGTDATPNLKMIDGKIIGLPPDPTEPDNTVKPLPEPLAAQKTLAQVATLLGEKLASSDTLLSKIGIKTVEADPAIARKTVCLFGESLVGPEQLLNAVITLYGLRSPKLKEGMVQITLPAPKSLEKGSEIPAEVARLLPVSFVRALVAGPHQILKGKTVDEQPADLAHLENVTADRLYLTSIKRLRAIAESPIDAAQKQNKTLLFQDLPIEAGDMAALSSLATCYGPIRSLTTPKPSLLDNLDKLTLAAQRFDDHVAYSIGFVDKDGVGHGTQANAGIPNRGKGVSLPK